MIEFFGALPLWALLLVVVLVILLIWKLIKFAIKILIIVIVFFLILIGLDVIGVFDAINNIVMSFI